MFYGLFAGACKSIEQDFVDFVSPSEISAGLSLMVTAITSLSSRPTEQGWDFCLSSNHEDY
jgi:hypothetical protein